MEEMVWLAPDGHRYRVSIERDPAKRRLVVFERDGWRGKAETFAGVTLLDLDSDDLMKGLEGAKRSPLYLRRLFEQQHDLSCRPSSDVHGVDSVMKKGFYVLALAAFGGLAACGTDDEPVILEEQPVIEIEQQPGAPPPMGLPPETDRMITDTMLGPDSAGEVMDTSLSPPPQ